MQYECKDNWQWRQRNKSRLQIISYRKLRRILELLPHRKGGESTHGLLNGGGAGWFGGGTGWLAAGGGSGYINTQYLQNSETTTSTHTGNGECKITVLK